MSEVLPIIYRSEWGDYYAPVEHYTLEQAIEEVADWVGEDEETVRASMYEGVRAIPLHKHSLDGDEIYECPNYDDEVGNEPGPCLGYIDCHVFE